MTARSDLTDSERYLLDWLGKEDFGQYGECKGSALDGLIAKGLAHVHGPGERQAGFIAQDHTGQHGMDYRAVSLTEAGVERLLATGGEHD